MWLECTGQVVNRPIYGVLASNVYTFLTYTRHRGWPLVIIAIISVFFSLLRISPFPFCYLDINLPNSSDRVRVTSTLRRSSAVRSRICSCISPLFHSIITGFNRVDRREGCRVEGSKAVGIANERDSVGMK